MSFAHARAFLCALSAIAAFSFPPPAQASVSSGGLTVSSPAPGATLSNPVVVKATAKESVPVANIQVWDNGVKLGAYNTTSLSQSFTLSPGSHTMSIQDVAAGTYAVLHVVKISFTVATSAMPGGAALLLQQKFQAGVNVSDSRYAFQNENLLYEEGNRLTSLKIPSIFAYLTYQNCSRYPNRGSGPQWSSCSPSSIVQFAQQAPMKAIFSMPFHEYLLTTYSMYNKDSIPNNSAFDTANGTAAQKEQQEFHDLAYWLLTTYKNTGKVFIIKNWEGDWMALGMGNSTAQLSSTVAQRMINAFAARERGIAQARADAGNPPGVAVFDAVEVNRVLDVAKGYSRLINKVVPYVKPDMVTYSSYDALYSGSTYSPIVSAYDQAFSIMRKYAPDPLSLGDKRFTVSEYGMAEINQSWSSCTARTQAALDASKQNGLTGAFFWTAYDNECSTNVIGALPGDPNRATASDCKGFWIIKPDGSQTQLMSILNPYFQMGW